MSDKYYVKAGKSVITAKGMKGPGDKVTEDMFSSPESFAIYLKSDKCAIAKEEPKNKKDIKAPEENKVEEKKEDKKESKFGGAIKK